jgi:hypothetical protein
MAHAAELEGGYVKGLFDWRRSVRDLSTGARFLT